MRRTEGFGFGHAENSQRHQTNSKFYLRTQEINATNDFPPILKYSL